MLPPQPERTDTPAGPVAAYRFGGEGDAVVLVPGLGVTSRYMHPTAAALADRGLVAWAVDLPGFGATPRPEARPTVEVLAAAVAAWLDALGVERPLLVANSLGCQVAADLVARRGAGAFAGCVLTGPTPDPAAPTLRAQAWRLARVAPHEPLSHDLRVAKDYLLHGPLYVTRTAWLALRDPVRDKLPALAELPSAVVRGEHDTIAPPAWAEHVAHLAGAELHVVAGHGHAVPCSAPDEVARIAAALREAA